MKRIKLAHGTARVSDSVSKKTIEALNSLSIKAYNMALIEHKYSYGDLMEVNEPNNEQGQNGARLFVKAKKRNMDGTPLYDIGLNSFLPQTEIIIDLLSIEGIEEDSLTLISKKV